MKPMPPFFPYAMRLAQMHRPSHSVHKPSRVDRHLVVVLVGVVLDNVEELELVDTLGGGDDTEPVTELLLLEELLGPGGGKDEKC